ncbi:MAG: SDR family NAD(P)-dependent oxidoreductase [Terriglobales bacterium]
MIAATTHSIHSPFSLEGHTAFISGGGTGLGFAMASAMIEAGAQVAIAGRRKEVLNQAVKELGPRAHAVTLDITEPNACEDCATILAETLGPISILVHNAGIHLKKSVRDTSVDEFTSVWQTHVQGAFALSRAFIPSMQQRRGGSILFIASMTSLIGMPQVVAYSAAKSAYIGMVRSLACELAEDGIRVNAIAPGWIETPMLHKALDNDPARKAKILSRTPLARFGHACDVGRAAVYLSSAAADFVTGVVLPVDGGASIGF